MKGDFEVTIRKNEVVAPEIAKQLEHRMPQSNLDLLLPEMDPSALFCYKKPLDDDKFTFECMVGILKKALAQTLVHFYPLAGEIVRNAAGEPEVLCNNFGVDFTEAFADVQLKDLNFHKPDENLGVKLIPVRKRGILAIQATELTCGGLVVGCTFDHRLNDAYGSHMFFVSWVELAQAKPLSHLPLFQRSLLLPRHPGRYDSRIQDSFVPISKLNFEASDDHDDQGGIRRRLYYVEAKKIRELQCLANNYDKNTDIIQHNKRTKLVSFSAFLWKTLASSAVDKGGDEKICKLGIVVDGRSRLGSGDEMLAKLMESYFGNVISVSLGQKKCEELEKKSLSWVANEVHDFLDGVTTKEHFLGLIDWVEANRPEPLVLKIYAPRAREEGPAVVISTGQRFPVGMMDFGWGVSAFSSYYPPLVGGQKAGYVVPMPSPIGNGDWIVYMHMIKEDLDFIETEAAHVFKPLTSSYLNLI